MTKGLPPAPDHLDANAAYAWGAIVRSLRASRALSDADLLQIEGASRAWARWRAVEDKIAELGRSNPIAAELTKDAGGGLKASALRLAANAAFAEYRDLTERLGVAREDQGQDLASIDLFGYPDRPGRGQRGRPRFTPTQRDRNRVRLLLAMGWSLQRVADAVEISVPLLYKYFKVELSERDKMRDRLEARRLEIAMEQANAGNITALRELDRLIEKNDRVFANARARQEPVEEEPEKLGKKEAQRRAAEEAIKGSDGWADLLRPGYTQ